LHDVVVIAVVTVCLPCFGLSLDCGHGFQIWARVCPRRAWSPEWLCIVYIVFALQTAWNFASWFSQQNSCHQMSDFTTKMHRIRFRLGLRPRPRWWRLQRSPRPCSWWGGG